MKKINQTQRHERHKEFPYLCVFRVFVFQFFNLLKAKQAVPRLLCS